jgi:hypothetical protein
LENKAFVVNKVGEGAAWKDGEMWTSTVQWGFSKYLAFAVLSCKDCCEVWQCQGRLWNLFLWSPKNKNKVFISVQDVWVKIFDRGTGIYCKYQMKANGCCIHVEIVFINLKERTQTLYFTCLHLLGTAFKSPNWVICSVVPCSAKCHH